MVRAILWAQDLHVGKSRPITVGAVRDSPFFFDTKRKKNYACSYRTFWGKKFFLTEALIEPWSLSSIFFLILMQMETSAAGNWRSNALGSKSFNVPRAAAYLHASSLITLPDRSWQLHCMPPPSQIVRHWICVFKLMIKLAGMLTFDTSFPGWKKHKHVCVPMTYDLGYI